MLNIQGLRGFIGQKGEPGFGVNMTELKEHLDQGRKGELCMQPRTHSHRRLHQTFI